MRPRTSLNKRHRKPKAQSRMDNSATSNGYTRHRTKTKKKQSKKKPKKQHNTNDCNDEQHSPPPKTGVKSGAPETI